MSQPCTQDDASALRGNLPAPGALHSQQEPLELRLAYDDDGGAWDALGAALRQQRLGFLDGRAPRVLFASPSYSSPPLLLLLLLRACAISMSHVPPSCSTKHWRVLPQGHNAHLTNQVSKLAKISSYIHKHKHRYTHTNTHTYIHTCTHTHTHTYTHTHTCTHAHTHTSTRTHTCTHTYTRAHAHTHTCTHTLVHTYTHTHRRRQEIICHRPRARTSRALSWKCT
jgi:hypothetical protein